MGRREDLEQHIQQSYQLIREYEDIRHLSSDPKEQARARRTIEEQWQFIKGHLDEYISLCKPLKVSIAADIIEIAIHFPEYETLFSPPKLGVAARDTPIPNLAQEKTMAGIPSHLSKPLREALAACDQFETNRSLRNVFAHEWLKPWRNSLPQAETLWDRVDDVIGFLHERYHRDGANALVLLLRVLSGQIDLSDNRHHQLATLADELERALGGGAPAAYLAPEANPTEGPMTYIAVDEKLLVCARAVGLVSVPKIAAGSDP